LALLADLKGGQSDMKRNAKGFTLIELLIVVAIIGIIAAIAIPNLLNAIDRGKQKRTMADMRSIATAWESRATDVGVYNAAGLSWPPSTVSAATLTTLLTPTYTKKIPVYDGWSNPFHVSDNVPNAYSIKSFGADRVENSTITSADAGIQTENFDCDIIMSGGVFVQYPSGVQSQ